MNLSGIKKIYFSDKPIAIAENCTISCDTTSEGSKDWSRIVPMSFTATIENPTYLLAFRLRYGVVDWLEWHDYIVRRFWYGYLPRFPIVTWEAVEEEIARYEEEYSKQINNG